MTHTNQQIPTREQVRTVLAAHCGTISSLAAAAMHLCTPVDVLIGPDIWRKDGHWHYRGVSAPILEDFDGAIDTALWMAESRGRNSDRYLDLSGDVGALIKIGASAGRKVAFGLPLLGGPALVSDMCFSDEIIRAAAARSLDGGLDALDCVFSDAKSTAFARVDSDFVTLITGDEWQ